MNVSAKIEGFDELFRSLSTHRQRVRSAIARKAVNAATKIVAKEAKRRVRVRTGLTRKSIGRVLRNYKGNYVGIVGPRRETVGVNPDGSKHVPANIAHILERDYPFMKPALEDTAQQQIAAMGDAVNKELTRLATRAK